MFPFSPYKEKKNKEVTFRKRAEQPPAATVTMQCDVGWVMAHSDVQNLIPGTCGDVIKGICRCG